MILWCNIFIGISNHVFDEGKNSKSVVIFIPDEKVPKTYNIKLSSDDFDKLEGDKLDGLIREGRIISDLILSGDNHTTDKINILK